MIDATYSPITFLGIADHIEESDHPFPIGPLSIFKLSHHKSHIFYPAFTSNDHWIFTINQNLLDYESLMKLELTIVDEEGKFHGKLKLFAEESKAEASTQPSQETTMSLIAIYKNVPLLLLHFKIDSLVLHPGKYIIFAKWNKKTVKIGETFFHYTPVPPLSIDQIEAIKSDPNSAKAIKLELGYKICVSKLKIYAGIERVKSLEDEGCIWQSNVGEEFKCECGITQYSLKYVKESLHGLLLKRLSPAMAGLSYIRRYAHSHIVDIITEFNLLLERVKDEKPIQEFIEKNPIMLARFHAKRLFIKPNILGKFETDFAILDTSNRLFLIEIEKPSLPLFKRDGHPTAKLMHAYGQVKDWLLEYGKYPTAVLDGLKIKPDQVVAIKGAIIAGHSTKETFEAMQRHMSRPPYPDVEFLTFDDLSRSLLEISRALA